MNGSKIIKEITGVWPVYPGHPLVVATAIMRLYPSFEEANKPTKHGWSEALGNSDVPGAGDHVGAAMRVLEMGAQGQSIEEMVAHASNYWVQGRAGGHVDNVEAGKQQAVKIEAAFRDMANRWFTH